MIVTVLTNYSRSLQAPIIISFSPLNVTKLEKYTYQSLLDKLLYFQEAFYKIHTPLFNQENATEKKLIRDKSDLLIYVSVHCFPV
jgi:hypothetical protein